MALGTSRGQGAASRLPPPHPSPNQAANKALLSAPRGGAPQSSGAGGTQQSAPILGSPKGLSSCQKGRQGGFHGQKCHHPGTLPKSLRADGPHLLSFI